jgi:autotransporter translocation and assembly factor TamB
MKTKIALCVAFIFVAGNITVQAGDRISFGDKKETRKVAPFTELTLSVSADLHLTQGDEHRLVLEGDEDELSKVETEVRGGQLRIKYDSPFNFGKHDRITIHVTMKDIEGLGVAGSGKIEAVTSIEADVLELDLTGSGDIVIDNLKADELESEISGSGDIQVGGSRQLQKMECDITGSGDFDAEDLEAKEAEIEISGSGQCKVAVVERLDVEITGSGKVWYKGQAAINADISGSGEVESY